MRGSLPAHMTFTGTPARAPAVSMRPRPGWSASNSWYVSMMRAPTTPGLPVQSAISSPVASDSGSKGLIRPNLPGCFAYTSSA